MNVPVYFDPKVIDAGPVPVRTQGEHLHITKNVMSIGKRKWVWSIGIA